MMIAIGSDHAGVELKREILAHLAELGHQAADFGADGTDEIDYPDVAGRVCRAVTGGECSCGVLICGTGIGMSIAANKFEGIRAALLSDCYSATMAKEHNDANIAAIGARVVGPKLALMMLDCWLNAKFSGGKHLARVAMLDRLHPLDRTL